jgi:hypothetical protein
MPLFHISSHPFQVGDIVQAGRWGSALRSYQFDAGSSGGAWNGWRLASEVILEKVRLQVAPHLPSRWDCSFAFDDLSVARAQGQLSQPNLTIYEVELVNPNAAVHRTDWHLMSAATRFASGKPFTMQTEQIARTYWSASVTPTIPEVLCASDLRVIAIVSTAGGGGAGGNVGAVPPPA